SMTVLPVRYQPNEPVENSLVGTTIGTSLMVIVTGLAWSRNWERVMGQMDFFAIASSLKRAASLASAGIIPRNPFHDTSRFRPPGTGLVTARARMLCAAAKIIHFSLGATEQSCTGVPA